MPKPRIIARVQTRNLRAELWANGVAAIMLLPGEADTPIAVPLNELLIKGHNEIGVMLHAAPLPSRSGEPWIDSGVAASYSGHASLSLRLAEYADNQTVTADNPPLIVTLDWQGEAVPRPNLLTEVFDLAAPLGPWGWQRAERFPALNEAVRRRAMEYLNSLHGMLFDRRYNEFIEQNSVKIEEMTALAYGAAPEPMRRSMRQVLEDHGKEPWRLQPFDPAIIDLRLVAGGRLIDCLRADRHNVLEYSRPDSKDTFFVPTMIGVLEGQWRVLR